MARESLSKKARFEIFKRDSFTCQYCGRQPPDVVLVIDHINPVKEGGDNDELNLITSCVDCNQGKGARKLNVISNRPDADLKWLEIQQEIVELRRYQFAKAERDRLHRQIIDGFQSKWWNVVSQDAPSERLFIRILTWASPDQIERAIEITGNKINSLRTFDDQYKYCLGVLHHMVIEEGD